MSFYDKTLYGRDDDMDDYGDGASTYDNNLFMGVRISWLILARKLLLALLASSAFRPISMA